jgi:nitrite reductase (NADH) small subunit
MENFVRIGKMSELPTRSGVSLRIGGEEVAVFRVGEEVVAVRNDCPHQHFSLLHQGELKNGALTCPMHGWTFDLMTGKSIVGNGTLKHYAVKIVGDDVWVEKPE